MPGMDACLLLCSVWRGFGSVPKSSTLLFWSAEINDKSQNLKDELSVSTCVSLSKQKFFCPNKRAPKSRVVKKQASEMLSANKSE